MPDPRPAPDVRLVALDMDDAAIIRDVASEYIPGYAVHDRLMRMADDHDKAVASPLSALLAALSSLSEEEAITLYNAVDRQIRYGPENAHD